MINKVQFKSAGTVGISQDVDTDDAVYDPYEERRELKRQRRSDVKERDLERKQKRKEKRREWC